MIYGNELNRMLKDEKNIVNRMYLNEILLQYSKYEHALTKDTGEESYFEDVAKAMNNFTFHIESSKYSYNRTTKYGFKKSSPVMSTSYIDDLLNNIIKKEKILAKKGIHWGVQSFTSDIKYETTSFCDLEKELSLNSKQTPNFFQLTQQIDLQFRVSGKKVFSKHTIVLPLLVFVVKKKLTDVDLISIEYYAKKAKRCFTKSKFIVICETVAADFDNEPLSPYVDIVFVLRKKRTAFRNGEIHPEVIKALSEKINDYLYSSESLNPDFEETGYIT